MTHTFNINSRSIRLVVSHNGKQYKRNTGLTIDPALWKKDAKSVLAQCRDKRIWEKLRPIHLRASEKEGWVESDKDALRVIEYASTGGCRMRLSRRRRRDSPFGNTSRNGRTGIAPKAAVSLPYPREQS